MAEQIEGVDIGTVVALAQFMSVKLAASNFVGMALKETKPNGDTIHTMTFLKNGTNYTYDLLTHAGVDSFLGEFNSLVALKTAYPTTVSTRFAVINDAVTTDNPNGTGVVSLATWDSTNNQYILTKLNQSIPVGTSGDSIGFVGTTQARLAMISNADWNTKTFLYYDTDVKVLMLYRPAGLCYEQYSGQIGGEAIPFNPVNGQVLIGVEDVYTWDDTKKFWKIVLNDSQYASKQEIPSNSYISYSLDGASLRVYNDGAGTYKVTLYQNIGMDTIRYAIDDGNPSTIVNSQGTETTLISSLSAGITRSVTVQLKHEGYGVTIGFVRYDNYIFATSFVKVISSDVTYERMFTTERKLYKTDAKSIDKKRIFDVDLNIEMLYLPNLSTHIGTFIQFWNQTETSIFPTTGLTDGQTFVGSCGYTYIYNVTNDYWATSGLATNTTNGLMSSADKIKLDSLSNMGIKNNLSASNIPTANDDASKGYSQGSQWVYNGTTYICTEATIGSAKWSSSADIFYFDTWQMLVTAISATGSTYVGKFAIVINANCGASSGATYTSSSGAVTNPIVDGGEAAYYISAQGSPYTVTCQRRTITNPVITSIMTTSSTKPVTAGYYIFSVIPSDGLPSGVALNDIAYYDGATWSRFSSYAGAGNSVLVGINSKCWCKSNSSWSQIATNMDSPTFTGLTITGGNTLIASNATETAAGLMSAADKFKLDGLSTVTVLDNLNATVAPTVNDDVTKGYSLKSQWIYNGITYVCVNNTIGAAEWISSADIYPFNTWSELVSLISITGTTYSGKYVVVWNANGAPTSGTYISNTSVSNPISDSSSMIFYINVQGNPFTITVFKKASASTTPILMAGLEMFWPNPTVPTGWFLEDGRAINRLSYADLFNALTFTLDIIQTTLNQTTVVVNDTSLLEVGYYVEGIGIQAGSRITAITSANNFVISQIGVSTQGGTKLRVFPFGNGDSSTTFNIPNMKGKVPVCVDLSDTTFKHVGMTGGEKAHSLTSTENGPHTHGAGLGGRSWNVSGSGTMCVDPGTRGQMYSNSSSIEIYSSGNGTAHNNLQPYGTRNMIIKY